MPRALEEYYEIDRERLPEVFTGEGYTYEVSLANTVRGYRTREGDIGVLSPRDFPVQRVITVFDRDGVPISRWTEDLEVDREFDADHVWVDLGPGVMPKNKHGLKRALFDIALGYLSGYPIKDILSYALKISLSEKHSLAIVEKQLNSPTYDRMFTRYEERVRIANPHYDERDT